MAKAIPVHAAPAEPEVKPEAAIVEAPAEQPQVDPRDALIAQLQAQLAAQPEVKAEAAPAGDPFARERARAEMAGFKVQDVAGVGKAKPALRIDY
jgi:hypothetical protein